MRTIILRFLFIYLSIALTSGFSQEKIVVGYYPDWVKFSLPASAIQLEHITHINHAFAWPQSNGELSMYNNMVSAALNETIHNAGRKILISVGGAGNSDGFPPMAADPVARANFIENITNFCIDNNYDGVDFDWEFPGNNQERANFTTLVMELRQKFDQVAPDMLITMATSPGNWFGQWFDYNALKQYMDWFNMMGYDFHGGWTSHAGHNAPLYAPSNDYDGSVHEGLQYLNVTRGIPKSQIVLGMPFYGRQFNASALYGPSTDGNTAWGYSDIVNFIASGWVRHWDNTSKVPYIINPEMTRLITYDDTASIRIKAQYALDQNLAGAMFWSMNHDKIGNQQPLVETLGTIMLSPVGIADPPRHSPSGFQLIGNYPNPFNPSTIIRYQLDKPAQVRLTIFNNFGQEIAELINSKQQPGVYDIPFNASQLGSGVYYYRLKTPGFQDVRKMILLR